MIWRLALGAGVGAVQLWAGHRGQPPEGWLICDGSELDSNDKQYIHLFVVIGTTYGVGVKPRSFKLPDLDRRIVVGSAKDDKDYAVGMIVGRDTQSASFTPSLNHQSMADAFQVNTENGFPTNPVVGANHQTVDFDVRQASVVMSYIIKFKP